MSRRFLPVFLCSLAAAAQAQPVLANELSPAYVGARSACAIPSQGFTADTWVSFMVQLPTEREQDRQFAELRGQAASHYRTCLERARNEARSEAERADASAYLARADSDVAAIYDRARAQVEADPARYLSMTWSTLQPARLREELAALRTVRSIAQTCGTFDFGQPNLASIDNAALRRLDARRMAYGDCVIAYRDRHLSVGSSVAQIWSGVEHANLWAAATRRYTCRVNRAPNCIPDQPYGEIASIATDANARLAKRQFDLLKSERAKANDIVLRLNDWFDTLNRRITARNAGY